MRDAGHARDAVVVVDATRGVSTEDRRWLDLLARASSPSVRFTKVRHARARGSLKMTPVTSSRRAARRAPASRAVGEARGSAAVSVRTRIRGNGGAGRSGWGVVCEVF